MSLRCKPNLKARVPADLRRDSPVGFMRLLGGSPIFKDYLAALATVKPGLGHPTIVSNSYRA